MCRPQPSQNYYLRGLSEMDKETLIASNKRVKTYTVGQNGKVKRKRNKIKNLEMSGKAYQTTK